MMTLRRGQRKAIIYGIILTGVICMLFKIKSFDMVIFNNRFNAFGLIQYVRGAQIRDVYTLDITIKQDDTVRQFDQAVAKPDSGKKYNILINSYMRCGSSFTGQLLGFNPGTFYWYEPLWNYNSGIYYWGKKYVCTGRTICGLARDKYSLNVERMQNVLKNILNCDFSTLTPAVAEEMTPSYSGNVWKPFVDCRKNGCSKDACLKEMEEVCRKSNHVATKVVRLTVDNMEYVLDNVPNVKVVHLIRDPRAIINSRITTTWYQLKETPEDNHRTIELDAKDTCLRIMYDLKAAMALKQKYPGRFSIVMFEDLQTNIKQKSEILYSYFGMDTDHLGAKLANMTGILKHEHTVQMTWGDYTNWWRFQLSFGAIQTIDKVCKEVNDVLGYRTFYNEKDLKNISLKAFSFSRQVLLENINYSDRYEFNLPTYS